MRKTRESLAVRAGWHGRIEFFAGYGFKWIRPHKCGGDKVDFPAISVESFS